MKITIARLRSNVNYKRPLDHILDSFYELYKEFMKKHPEYEYGCYNFSWSGRPKRDVDEIASADIVIVPTENEFHYHIPNYIHPGNLERCNNAIDLIKPHLNDKRLILFRSDRADSVELYKKYTFKGISFKDVLVLDEDDFQHGIHGMKYHFITKQFDSGLPFVLDENYPIYDFGYWGTDKRKVAGGEKSNDERYSVLKHISKSDLNCMWIGRFANIKRNYPMLPMREVITHIEHCDTTLCFNWMDKNALTSRYAEALACGTIPLVWKNYDSTNRVVAFDWQRCYNKEEAVQRIKEVNPQHDFLYHEVLNAYLKNLPSKKEYYESFEKLLLEKIGK